MPDTKADTPTDGTRPAVAPPPELTRQQIERSRGCTATATCSSPPPTRRCPRPACRPRKRWASIEQEMVLDGLPDAQPRDLRDDLDGAGGGAGDHEKPPRQLHRPRRVPADGRDRAALHPHARRPLQRARRDHRRAHPGLLGGDHARRAVAEVEVARAHARRRASPADGPNLVFGGDVHVVWEKFCRYFDVEPRIVPLQPDKYTIGPEDVEPHIDENTIGVAAVLGTTFTGHADDIARHQRLPASTLKERQGLDVPLHVDAASGGFVWPFLYPHSEWDFRLEQVRSINVSGHKFGLVYPGIGWLIFREKADLAEELVFYENYLGKRDATFTLNFSTGAAMVLAQYYNFVRLGHDGLPLRDGDDAARTPARWPRRSRLIGEFDIIGGETRSSCRWSRSNSRGSTATTSSTSPRSWRPSAAGWSPPTRCRRTPST